MSQYTIRGKHPGISALVGWDPPTQTFFVQVHDAAKDEESNPILWRGTKSGELPDIADLRRVLEPHADLPPLIASCLDHDQDADQ